MTESFVFTGIGFETGKYAILNADIEQYINSGYLEGFDAKRIENTEDFKLFKQTNPNETAFGYMTGHIMGFRKRFNVVPFPPAVHKFREAENSLDLCVAAIDKALSKAGLIGNEIDAWFIGTATAHQYAPGIAEFAKAYFTDIENQSPTYSLTSACVGFNINLSNALMYFQMHPEANNIIVAHAEVMSALLPETRDFVPFSTFGDSAAAVVVSRTQTKTKQGIVAIANNEDGRMLDFLGADKKGNLYMNPRMVKFRAVPNIAATASKLMQNLGWKNEDIKYFIPHQTGNAIVDSVTEKLAMPKDKVFKEIQINYGNLSGASVPACLSLLQDANKLQANDKIVTAVAGLGGEFGGFAYVVPEDFPVKIRKQELDGKVLLITGASGGIGREIAIKAAEKGAKIILHYNKGKAAIDELKSEIVTKFGVVPDSYSADLRNIEEIENLRNHIVAKYGKLNILINTHAITGSLGKASAVSVDEFTNVLNANYYSVKNLCDKLVDIITDSILITGSVGEDAQFAGSSSYVAAKRALRAYSVSLASKIYQQNLRCIYYLPGIVDSGMMSKLEESQVNASMNSVRQKALIPVKDIAERMLKSSYRLKVPNVRISYESHLMVVKDGYFNF